MEVERIGTEDINALVQLRLDYMREDMGRLDADDAKQMESLLPDYFKRHINRDLFVYGIREGEDIAACVFLLVIEKPMNPAFINGMTATVMNVYTRPVSRHRGYATMLMRALLDDAKQMGIAVIELKATDAGYPLYSAVGFSDEHSKYHRMVWHSEDETTSGH